MPPERLQGQVSLPLPIIPFKTTARRSLRLFKQLFQPTDMVLLPGLLGQIHVRVVKVEFGALALAIDSKGCDRRSDSQRQQQQNGCPAETGDGWFAPAPAPDRLDAIDRK